MLPGSYYDITAESFGDVRKHGIELKNVFQLLDAARHPTGVVIHKVGFGLKTP